MESQLRGYYFSHDFEPNRSQDKCPTGWGTLKYRHTHATDDISMTGIIICLIHDYVFQVSGSYCPRYNSVICRTLNYIVLCVYYLEKVVIEVDIGFDGIHLLGAGSYLDIYREDLTKCYRLSWGLEAEVDRSECQNSTRQTT